MLPLLSSPHLNSTRINSNQLNRNSTKLCCGFSLLAFVGIGLLPFSLLRSQQTLTHTRTGNLGFRRFSESSFCSLSLSRRIHLTVARARARALDSSGPTWLTALSTAAAAAALRRQQKQKQQPGRRRRRNSSSASNPIARLVLRRRRRFRSSRRFSVSGSLLVTHSRSIWLPARSSRSQLA